MHKNEPKGGFMLYHFNDTNKIVGTKQTLKALGLGQVKVVYVAKDADDKVTRPIVELAKAQMVQVEYMDTMKELGQKCNVEVKTAVAAIIV